jgi:hypothetical protein
MRYLVALSPLLLLPIGLVAALIGFHYARLEREERARLEAMKSKPSSSAN